MYQSTEIVMLPFPFTDLSSMKKRSVLVITPTDNRGDMLVAQITSKNGYLDAVQLVESDVFEGLLPKTSYVRSTKIMTVNQSIIVGRFGRLSLEKFNQLKLRVCAHVGCNAW